MLKAFLKILLLVLVPIAFLLLWESYSPIYHLQKSLATSYLERTFKGTFYLLEQELDSQPQAQWPDYFQTLSDQFAYQTKLIPLEDFQYDPDLYNRLKAGKYEFDETEHEVLRHRIANSPWVVELVLEPTNAETMDRDAQGTIYLLKQYFSNVPQERWDAKLVELEKHFGFDLLLVKRDQLEWNKYNLSAKKLQTLDSTGSVWLGINDEVEYYYIALPGSDKVLIGGPISSEGINSTMLAGIVIAIVSAVSMGIFLWLYPLWRDLKKLGEVTVDFGHGNLNRRVKIGKRSLVSRLGGSFNSMANKIEVLIDDHRHLTDALAHDLRTPLSRFRFAMEMLDSEGATEEEKQRYRDSINNSIDSLDYLINQLLIHSRYNRVADIAHFARCDLAEVIGHEVELSRRSCPALKIEFNISTDASQNFVVADRRALIRALDNLLGNACRFAHSVIRVSVFIRGHHYYLQVEDDGPGIPERQYAAVTQAFSQIDNMERSLKGNHGLGLAIVKNIAQWHSGELHIFRSELGGAGIAISWPDNLKQSS